MPDATWEDLFDLETTGFSTRDIEEIKLGLEALFKSLDQDGLRRAKAFADELKSDNNLKIPLKIATNPNITGRVVGIRYEFPTPNPVFKIPERILFNPKNIKKHKYLTKTGNLEKYGLVRTSIHEALHVLYPEDEENKIVERTNAVVNTLKGTKYFSEERFGYFFGKDQYDPHLKLCKKILKSYGDGVIDKREEFKINKLLSGTDYITLKVYNNGKNVIGHVDYTNIETSVDIGNAETFTLSPNGIKVE